MSLTRIIRLRPGEHRLEPVIDFEAAVGAERQAWTALQAALDDPNRTAIRKIQSIRDHINAFPDGATSYEMRKRLEKDLTTLWTTSSTAYAQLTAAEAYRRLSLDRSLDSVIDVRVRAMLPRPVVFAPRAGYDRALLPIITLDDAGGIFSFGYGDRGIRAMRALNDRPRTTLIEGLDSGRLLNVLTFRAAGAPLAIAVIEGATANIVDLKALKPRLRVPASALPSYQSTLHIRANFEDRGVAGVVRFNDQLQPETLINQPLERRADALFLLPNDHLLTIANIRRPDGLFSVSVSVQPRAGGVRDVLDLPVAGFAEPLDVRAFSDDGSMVAIGGATEGLALLALNPLRSVYTMKGAYRNVKISSDGARLFIASDTDVRLFETRRTAAYQSIPGRWNILALIESGPTLLLQSPVNEAISAVSLNRRLDVQEITTGRALAFSSDGARCIVADRRSGEASIVSIDGGSKRLISFDRIRLRSPDLPLGYFPEAAALDDALGIAAFIDKNGYVLIIDAYAPEGLDEKDALTLNAMRQKPR